MNIKVNANIFKGVLFLAIAGIILAVTPSQVGVIAGETINSRSFPYLIITVMAISSVLLILQGIFDKEKEYWNFNVEAAKEWIPPLSVFALLMAYVYSMPYIGYVLSSLVASTLILVLVKAKKPLYYIISFIFVFVIYYVFTKFLLVPLPSFSL